MPNKFNVFVFSRVRRLQVEAPLGILEGANGWLFCSEGSFVSQALKLS